MTAWTDFVKTYAKEHNISYKDAMKEAKESYANTKVETKVKKVETTLSEEEEKKIYDDAIFLLILEIVLDFSGRKQLSEKVEKKMRELLPFPTRVLKILRSDKGYYRDDWDNIVRPLGILPYEELKDYTDDELKNYKKGITKSVNDTLKSFEKRYKKQKLTPDLLNFAIAPKNEKKVRRRAIFYDGRWV